MMETLFQRYDRLLYVVRHGEAKSESEDPARPLSDPGRDTVQKMACWATRVGMRVEAIEHSGKLRAAQTAEILAEHLQPAGGCCAAEGLRPHDSVAGIAMRLERAPGSRMLVGHLPQLERLVAALTVHNPDAAIVRLDPAAIAILAPAENGWVLLGVIQPDLIA
jgi:phosphohistidine phosphatase